MFTRILRAGIRSPSTFRAFSVQSSARNATEATYKAPALGVNKTYDEALKVIAEDKIRRLADIKALRTQLEQLTKASPSATRDADIETLKETIFKQEAYSEINDPEIQWKFKNGQVDMSKAVFRYMKGKQFTRETLPIVQQRITQMNVTPDLLPNFTPTMNVQLDFGAGSSPKVPAGSDPSSNFFETGSFLLPGKTTQAPKVHITSFHPETKYYTIALVDPDMPDVENETYKQQMHWLIANVPISATQNEVTTEGADIILSYLPPHPPKGTEYHRYTVLVAEQPNGGQDKIQMDQSQVSRDLTVGDLCAEHQLSVKGLTFFRQVWDKDVSRIYKDILKQDEPAYGRPVKVDALLDETGQMKKKYVNL
ncbi:hypothetical protein BGW38_007849 [Lunasporangiospora selenospora]|uniref:PEBP-like protein n=1 Tax=Lunasporangiospora selenospora TaxID=979761 RepID=A0A9P6FYB8_9FUNG|nr:hypothetical protein BGW38_007849 [Lunasporangiospora selenospora]